MNNLYIRDCINYMTFSHLCYISVRDKGTLVRVKFQVNQEQEFLLFQIYIEIIISNSYL